MKEVKKVLNGNVSVVIIGKNEELNIVRCINSIKNIVNYQLFILEIIYIDGGSKDKTIFNINSTHNDVKIYKIEDEEVKTAAKGRHLGALLSKGEYILFLDADMEIHKLFVNKILEVANKRSDFIGGIGIRNDIYLNEGVQMYEVNNVYNTHIEKKCNHFGGALFIRKNFLLEVGNYGSCIIANEEAELDSRIKKRGMYIKEYPFEMINHYIHQEDNKKSLRNIIFGIKNQGIGQGFRHSFHFRSTLNFIKRFNLFFISFVIDITSLILVFLSVVNISLLIVAILIQVILVLFYASKRKIKFYVLNKIYALHFVKGVLNYNPNHKINFTEIEN